MGKKIVGLTFAAALLMAAAVPAFGVVGTASAEPAGKVTICHRTGSESNPWVVVTISENAWSDPGHMQHNPFNYDDFVVAQGGVCGEREGE